MKLCNSQGFIRVYLCFTDGSSSFKSERTKVARKNNFIDHELKPTTMLTEQSLISDTELISMIEENNHSAWEYLYKKYNEVIYGAILRLTDNETIAKEILTQLFVELKANKALLRSKKPLCLCLLHHAYTISIKVLSTYEIKPQSNMAKPSLPDLIYKPYSLKDMAEKNSVTEAEIKLRLRSELNQYRRQAV